ncbi:type 4 pilus major pilin [Burkholderia glumae]|uniref:type 4 pilus major pilin n=1 Tax=Burkholderia glumae TaxID=337 RepID=UPI002036F74F|nr:type 4 pilus major pilin [Burkholderia glumae]MCM2552669.1 hypothetical protein [Burkholderia glumae]MCQ0031464.1 hypothetical protein [Burkholderia glumae]MCQ0035116.1 hypothetical protein [Burkholderia glumae]MCR1769763.1 hypothetical protein [Burkholderia glumae]UVT00058.1 hypothetical protein EFP19_30885 [Burkholderia glumae]
MQAIVATLIALAVTAMGVIEVMQHSDSLFGSSKVSGQITDIADLMSHSKQKMGALPNRYLNFSSAGALSLSAAGIIPPTMIVNGVLLNRWGMGITLGNARTGGQAFFSTTWPDVTTCADIASGLGGYESITIGSTTFDRSNPPDAPTAANACSAGLTMTVSWS